MAGGFKLQDAATTGNGNEVDLRGEAGRYLLTVQGTGTITAGEIQWEQAVTAGYSGTWAPLGPPITVVSSQVITQTYTGPLLKVRARVSVNVAGGGSVTVKMQPPAAGEA